MTFFRAAPRRLESLKPFPRIGPPSLSKDAEALSIHNGKFAVGARPRREIIAEHPIIQIVPALTAGLRIA